MTTFLDLALPVRYETLEVAGLEPTNDCSTRVPVDRVARELEERHAAVHGFVSTNESAKPRDRDTLLFQFCECVENADAFA
jgi:hypothetical protein